MKITAKNGKHYLTGSTTELLSVLAQANDASYRSVEQTMVMFSQAFRSMIKILNIVYGPQIAEMTERMPAHNKNNRFITPSMGRQIQQEHIHKQITDETLTQLQDIMKDIYPKIAEAINIINSKKPS